MEGQKDFSEKCLYQIIDYNASECCRHSKKIIKLIKKYDKQVNKKDKSYVPEFYEKYFTLNMYFYTYEEVIKFIKFMKKYLNKNKLENLDDYVFTFISEYEDKKYGIITLNYFISCDICQEEIIASPKITTLLFQKKKSIDNCVVVEEN